MRTLTAAEFLRWAEEHGLRLDPQYPQSAVLAFAAGSGEVRFWRVPAHPELRSYFLASFLELLGDWHRCFAWRHLGSWPGTGDIDPNWANEVVEHRILKGLGLPLGTADVVEFDRTDSDTLLALLFSTTIFGWSVGEDLYVVPEPARYIIQTDHHRVVHVKFRDPTDVQRWVRIMADRDFPLPDRVPDESSKQPPWMPQNDR
jgi:hypothetical protein